ncbi:thiazolylpeptide-type bacteriocin [Actinokineospora sp.]|uniref:thiazolylpeptide-type bacteriocin n=1 Tax=Actinokineospora sp. TaxID=1872133 RepID=UPI004038221E
MSDHMRDTLFEIDDLRFDDIEVTSMRDVTALPETGASGGTSSCSCSGCSCCQPMK